MSPPLPRATWAMSGSGTGLRPMIRLSSPRTTGRTSRGTSAVAVPMSKVTGRSRITTCRSVRAKSWIIGLPCTSMSTLRRIRPDGVEHGVGHAVAAHPAVGHGVQLAGVRVLGAGARCSPAGPGCSAGCRRSRSGPTVSSSWVSSYGGGPDSTSASVRPPCTSTLVLAAKSKPPGVPRTGSPSASATPAERTHGCGTTAPVRRGAGRRAPCPRRGTSGAGRPGRRAGSARSAGSGRRGGRAAPR